MARFSLKWLFVGVAVVAAIATALLNPNPFWEAAIVGSVYASLAFAVLEWAIRKRAWSIGFAVGGWSYFLMAQSTIKVTELLAMNLFGPGLFYYCRVAIVEASCGLVCATFGMIVGLYLHGRQDGGPAR